jgi:hypothetical protein
MSDLEQAISRLEAHERECSIRYQMIQMQLDNQRFDKLDKMMTGGFASIAVIVTVAIAVLEFAR